MSAEQQIVPDYYESLVEIDGQGNVVPIVRAKSAQIAPEATPAKSKQH